MDADPVTIEPTNTREIQPTGRTPVRRPRRHRRPRRTRLPTPRTPHEPEPSRFARRAAATDAINCRTNAFRDRPDARASASNSAKSSRGTARTVIGVVHDLPIELEPMQPP
jgi:hypothetical protein